MFWGVFYLMRHLETHLKSAKDVEGMVFRDTLWGVRSVLRLPRLPAGTYRSSPALCQYRLLNIRLQLGDLQLEVCITWLVNYWDTKSPKPSSRASWAVSLVVRWLGSSVRMFGARWRSWTKGFWEECSSWSPPQAPMSPEPWKARMSWSQGFPCQP